MKLSLLDPSIQKSYISVFTTVGIQTPEGFPERNINNHMYRNNPEEIVNTRKNGK